jgi:putative transcriptional regulator
MKMVRKTRKSSGSGYLDGQLLIAMPTMIDRRFARSVIYLCAHSAEGAMGLIINQRASHISFPDLLERLEIVEADRRPGLPHRNHRYPQGHGCR